MTANTLRAAAAALLLVGVAASAQEMTIRDSIEMPEFSLRGWGPAGRQSEAGVFAPDGRSFVTVVRQGDLDANVVRYSLLRWTIGVDASVSAATTLLTLESSSSRPAIDGPQWSQDGSRIYFLGEHPGELHQVYALDAGTRQLTNLTNSPTNVVGFSLAGNRLVYLAEVPTKSYYGERQMLDGLVVSHQFIGTLLLGEGMAGFRGGVALDNEFYVRDLRNPSAAPKSLGRIPGWAGRHELSPDGKYLLFQTFQARTPESWSGYSSRKVNQFTLKPNYPTSRAALRSLQLTEVETGRTWVAVNAPIDGEFVWLPDGRSFVFGPAFLPLEGVSEAQKKIRAEKFFYAVVDVDSGAIEPIAGGDFGPRTIEVARNRIALVAPKSGGMATQPPVVFQRQGQRWVKRTAAEKPSAPQAQVFIVEDMNAAPRLLYWGKNAKEAKSILDLGQHLRGKRLATVQELRWKTGTGYEARAGLYLPAEVTAGRRLPLVIQTHGWNRRRFSLDGASTSGFAAQALAARGIAVLQVQEESADQNTPEEWKSAVELYDSAVDLLEGLGTIDPARVGLIGWSYSCSYVKHALVAGRHKYAAAMVIEGLDDGYLQYLLTMNRENSFRAYEGRNGGEPLYADSGLKKWLQHSPSFQIGKVDTPMRIVASNPMGILFDWEWLAALQRMRKPVEMISLKEADHVVTRPWERRIVQGGNVDWFAFWLGGTKDPDASKADQYRRWEALRQLRSFQ